MFLGSSSWSKEHLDGLAWSCSISAHNSLRSFCEFGAFMAATRGLIHGSEKGPTKANFAARSSLTKSKMSFRWIFSLGFIALLFSLAHSSLPKVLSLVCSRTENSSGLIGYFTPSQLVIILRDIGTLLSMLSTRGTDFVCCLVACLLDIDEGSLLYHEASRSLARTRRESLTSSGKFCFTSRAVSYSPSKVRSSLDLLKEFQEKSLYRKPSALVELIFYNQQRQTTTAMKRMTKECKSLAAMFLQQQDQNFPSSSSQRLFSRMPFVNRIHLHNIMSNAFEHFKMQSLDTGICFVFKMGI
nr:hypothetical protein Iba_chr01eCG5880 [Ipomoea batatas]